MSSFPVGAGLDLKSSNIPAALLETCQKIADCLPANRPDGLTLALTFSQSSASISAAIPAKIVSFFSGVSALNSRLVFGGAEKTYEELPANFKIQFPDGGGQPAPTPLSDALIQLAFCLKEAERLSPSTPAMIATISYSDATQVFSFTCTLPIDITIGNMGQLLITATDYVAPSATWGDLLLA